MAHGGPDYDVTAGVRTTYRWADLDELAARLGSPVVFDRRGDVILIDSFEDGWGRWTPNIAGAGGSIQLSRARSRSGAYSLRLVAPPVVMGLARVYTYLDYPVLGAFGLESSWVPGLTMESLYMRLYVETTTVTYQIGVRFTPGSGNIDLWIPPGVWTTVYHQAAGGWGVPVFRTWKVVANPVSGHYVRLLYGSIVIDASPYAIAVAGGLPLPTAEIDIGFYCNSPTPCNSYLDDVILTQNEPT